MSDEHKDFYYHVHEDDHHHHPPSASLDNYASFDPSAYMSFTDCLQYGTMDYNTLTKAFGLSPSSELVEVNPNKPVEAGDFSGGGGGGGNSSEIPVSTPNSSVSFSSGDAAGDQEDSGKSSEMDRQQKGSDDSRECSKKGNNKEKKKGEKRQREPRFAFMTKSEVDHLEDGYRWRKYGQKAVKNSPYPRSYYRCTTQKCTVKKRVERSFQDPTIVITTYEGQHNHPIPTTLRGNAAAMFSHSVLTPAPMAARPGFSQDHFLLSSMSNQLLGGGGGGVSSLFPQNVNYQHNHGQYQVPDYGLLQDVVPSMFSKQEP